MSLIDLHWHVLGAIAVLMVAGCNTDTKLFSTADGSVIDMSVPERATARRITVYDDVAYRSGDSKAWRLDLAVPEPTDGKLRPAIVIIHGGGWRAGSKQDRAYRDLLMHYAIKGYVSMSVDYRLTDEAPLPACIEDVKCAVRWLRAHAKQYHVDPEKIGSYGHSAGAHLSMMLAMLPASAGVAETGGWEQYSSRVNAAAGGATPVKVRPERIPNAEKWSPMTYISADVPPILLISGTEDERVPIATNDEFIDKLKAAGAKDVTYLRVEGANHGVAYEFFLDRTQKTMDDFFDRTLRGRTPATAPIAQATTAPR